MSSDTPEPREKALKTAEDLREDLEALAGSDLPFARDAEQILRALDQANQGKDEHK